MIVGKNVVFIPTLVDLVTSRITTILFKWRFRTIVECPPLESDRDVKAINHFQFGGWDSYYLYHLDYKMEAEAKVEAVEEA